MILSGEMMLRHLGWTEAADLIVKGMEGTIASKQVTYDFARLMEGATELTTSAVRRRDDCKYVGGKLSALSVGSALVLTAVAENRWPVAES